MSKRVKSDSANLNPEALKGGNEKYDHYADSDGVGMDNKDATVDTGFRTCSGKALRVNASAMEAEVEKWKGYDCDSKGEGVQPSNSISSQLIESLNVLKCDSQVSGFKQEACDVASSEQQEQIDPIAPGEVNTNLDLNNCPCPPQFSSKDRLKCNQAVILGSVRLVSKSDTPPAPLKGSVHSSMGGDLSGRKSIDELMKDEFVRELKVYVTRCFGEMYKIERNGKTEFCSSAAYPKILETNKRDLASEKANLWNKVGKAVILSAKYKILPKEVDPITYSCVLNWNNKSFSDLVSIHCHADEYNVNRMMTSLSPVMREKVATEKKRLDDELNHQINSDFTRRIWKLEQSYKLTVTEVVGFYCIDYDRGERSAYVTVYSPKYMTRIEEERAYFIRDVTVDEGAEGKDVKLSISPGSIVEEIVGIRMLTPIADLYKRRYFSFDEILGGDFHPLYDLVDTCGLVTDVGCYDKSVGQFVTLKDKTGEAIRIHFWKSINAFGLDEIIRVGHVLAIRNLYWRKVLSRKFKVAYLKEYSIFETYTSAVHLVQPLADLTSYFIDKEHIEGNAMPDLSGTRKRQSSESSVPVSSKVSKKEN